MNQKDYDQAKRLILSNLEKQIRKKKTELTLELKEFLYSNYKNSNDKPNWKMDTMNYLIWIESCLEGLAYNRINDTQLNEIVMSLIGFIKFNGFETNTEVKNF